MLNGIAFALAHAFDDGIYVDIIWLRTIYQSKINEI